MCFSKALKAFETLNVAKSNLPLFVWWIFLAQWSYFHLSMLCLSRVMRIISTFKLTFNKNNSGHCSSRQVKVGLHIMQISNFHHKTRANPEQLW